MEELLLQSRSAKVVAYVIEPLQKTRLFRVYEHLTCFFSLNKNSVTSVIFFLYNFFRFLYSSISNGTHSIVCFRKHWKNTVIKKFYVFFIKVGEQNRELLIVNSGNYLFIYFAVSIEVSCYSSEVFHLTSTIYVIGTVF